MPFIYPVFPASDTEVYELIAEHKTLIRTTFADLLGYRPETVALKSEPILEARMRICDNISRLEFIIDTGKESLPMDDAVTGRMGKQLLKKCPFLAPIKFGIWVRPMRDNGYWEHVPAT